MCGRGIRESQIRTVSACIGPRAVVSSSAGRLAFLKATSTVGGTTPSRERLSVAPTVDATNASGVQAVPYTPPGEPTRSGVRERLSVAPTLERATQYELSVRVRPREAISLRVGVYYKRLDGLVASVPLGVNPDSTIFGNADAGTTRGVEVLAEREMRSGYGFRVVYTLQSAKATSTDPFLLNRLLVVDPRDGFVANRDELFPMYQAAAGDYSQPWFAYGPPRLARLGIELLF